MDGMTAKAKKSDAEQAASGFDDQLWQAILRRDPAWDGRAYYGVITTGIYCRPTCPSRRPHRTNVGFYPAPELAEAAGFRPCKRCTPRGASQRDADAALVASACRVIESAESEPALAELAQMANLSPAHFHRLFKSVVGVTPKSYATARRRIRVQAQLNGGSSVTHAIFEAGYNSSARFYAGAKGMLGMSPTAYRAGGAHTALRYAVGSCSLGCLLVAASDVGIAAILIGDHESALMDDLKTRFPNACLTVGDHRFQATVTAVVHLVEEPQSGLALPLDIRGTAFQHRVWEALRAIPSGQTASYAEIARAIDRPKAIRAVAAACAANPAAVAIPCHRVVRSDGGLSGYRWGVSRKRALLERESRQKGKPVACGKKGP